MIKLLLRTIKNSLGRFIAISLIIMLGTLIFVGVKATGPALNDSLQATVVKHHLSDLEILSSQGFTETELKAVRQVPGAQVEGVLLQNVLGGKNRDAIALYGYQKNNLQNQLILKQGRLPRNQHEIVLDQQARLRGGYKIGDYFNLEKNPQLKYQKYRIVGFADSPQYVDHSTRGASNLGAGKVTYFAYVSHLAFRSSVYSGMQVYFPELQNQKMFSNKYERAVKRKTAQVRRQLTPAVKKRRQSLTKNALTQIEQGKQRLAQSRQKLVAAQQVLKQQGLTDASAMRTLQRQEAKLQQQRRQLDQQAQRIKKALQPSLLYQTRQDLPGFTGYGESSQRIATIANVFPLFFFLLAGLITFTTVTRMVEEQRGQMGTLKALGYGKGAIVFQYVAYAGLAGISGAAVGAVLGNQLIPRIVLAMYQEYVVEIVKIPVDWRAIALAALLTLLVTIGAATLVSLREVRASPAALLRPRAPRAAHKILLERVPGLWRRLRFFQKISYRNLSRAKLRGLMTILGIAGGTALILTGFGIASSIKEAGNQQFQNVLRYDAVVRARQPKDLTSVQNSLERSAATRATLPVYTAVVQVNQRQKTVRDVTLTVPKNPRQFDQFVRLRDYQSNHSVGLPTGGVVVSPKVARILHVQVGDQIKIRVPNQKTVQVRIAKVVTNYAGNVIYASPSYTKPSCFSFCLG
ncbi:ABC transporter permease [Pediococcus acidilactici]